jgi:hydrogenase expression/formation protein HypE
MDERITLSHGGGGSRTRDLVQDVFIAAYGGEALSRLGDSAVLEMGPGRLAFTTDAFVVKPLFFQGGDIGRLAVSGTVNDLAAVGARPIALAVSFVIEEGLEIELLRRVVASVAATAREAEVEIATGDTKVVERGAADGLFVTTSGVGLVPPGRDLSPRRIVPGDRVLVTGTLGDHGVAVMSEREGIRFTTSVSSDVAPLASLAKAMAEAGGLRALRDPTRGGAAAALNEMALEAGVGVCLVEEDVPIRASVASACDLLGLDPMSVANEGKFVAFVAEEHAEAMLELVRAHPLGRDGAIVGEAVASHRGVVVTRTTVGGRRVVEMPLGEGLPRIC